MDLIGNPHAVEEDPQEYYSDVKSDIFQEKNDKFMHLINEWFTLIFVMLCHNMDGKELADMPSFNPLSPRSTLEN